MCGCLSHALYWGPGPQPRLVPWLGIRLWAFSWQASSPSTEPHQQGPHFYHFNRNNTTRPWGPLRIHKDCWCPTRHIVGAQVSFYLFIFLPFKNWDVIQHAIQFIIWMYRSVVFVYIQTCATIHHHLILERFHHLKKKPCTPTPPDPGEH